MTTAVDSWSIAVKKLIEMGSDHFEQLTNDRYMRRKTYFAGSPRARGCVCVYCEMEL